MGLLPLLSLNMDICDFVIFPFNEGNCPFMFEQNLLFFIFYFYFLFFYSIVF